MSKSRLLKLLLFLTIVLAFVVRLAIFTQSRDLFIDEANVARNIYEKDYAALAGELDYAQFAPPIFLFATKLSTQLFGFYEMALRLLPFLAGMASIFLLVYLIDLLLDKHYAIYPLALFAGGYVFLHYGTELKQYSSDFLVSLILVITALKTRKHLASWRFVLFWILLGFVALWSSMPSVFLLFTIGVYWLWEIYLTRSFSKLPAIIFIGISYLLQFGVYYYFVLQHQISSDYLQNYHAHAFLIPSLSFEAWSHNIRLLSGIITQAGGHTLIAIILNCLLLAVGVFYLIKKQRSKSILILLPFVLLILASLLHKYAIVSRLVLYIQVFVFVLLAFGVYGVFQLKSWWWRVPVIASMLLAVINHQNFKHIYERFEIQEIHYALDELSKDHLEQNNDPIWVHNGALPAFKFYTEISPKKRKYDFESKITFLDWDSQYETLLKDVSKGESAWLLLSNYFPEDLEKIGAIEGATVAKKIDKPGCLLFLIEKQ